MDASNETELASFAEVVCERDRDSPISPSELVANMEGCSAILSLNGYGSREITDDVLRAVGTVRLICVAHYWGRGHFSSISAESGITVVEGSNAGSAAVAEWVMAAAFMSTSRLHDFNRQLKGGSPWAEPRRAAGLLSSSTVGLVGLGRTGLYTARCFRALGINVVAFSRSCSQEMARSLGIRLMPLDDLLATADMISLHARVTDETRGMVGAEQLAVIKSGAVFINAARAELYDEVALIRELRTGRFSAYIDVFADEPLPLDHPFRAMDNVVVTPHIAANNGPMFLRCGRDAIATLREWALFGTVNDRRYAFPEPIAFPTMTKRDG